jgi:hypothetical protein
MVIPSAVSGPAFTWRRRCLDICKPAIWALLTALICIPVVSAPARAQSQGEVVTTIPVGLGILNTMAYQPIAAGSGFDTNVRDSDTVGGSALDNAVLDRVNKELVARGYHVDHDAALVMLVAGDLIRGASKDAMIDEIKGIGAHHDEHQGNVFSTNGKTLLTQPTPDNHPNTFRISVSVYDRKSGIYIWRGTIERGTSDLAPDQATEHMVPPLVATIGKTEQNRNVNIGTNE